MIYQQLNLNKIKLENGDLDFILIENVFIYCVEHSFGLIYNNFQRIIPPIYDEIIPAFTAHFWGRRKNKWRLYNFQNEAISANIYQRVAPFYNHFACVSENGKYFGFIGRSGNYILEPKYFGGKHLGNSLFAVVANEFEPKKYNIIDLQGKKMLHRQFSEVPAFSEVVHLHLKQRKPLWKWLRLYVF